jgi:hypothetical protein
MSVALALLALIVAAPAMAVIALAIKLESRGPVFFIQDRVGLRGQRFRLVKFRTMRETGPATDSMWGRDNASRVTRLGAVLRRYRLDELPQCLNILRGDMSLVGPRPEMASNVANLLGGNPLLRPPPRGEPWPHGLGADQGQLRDVEPGSDAQALLRPLLHRAHVGAVRSADPGGHGEVRPQQQTSGMSDNLYSNRAASVPMSAGSACATNGGARTRA